METHENGIILEDISIELLQLVITILDEREHVGNGDLNLVRIANLMDFSVSNLQMIRTQIYEYLKILPHENSNDFAKSDGAGHDD